MARHKTVALVTTPDGSFTCLQAAGSSDPQRLAELRRMIANGASLGALASWWGITRQASAQRLQRLGLKTINRVGRPRVDRQRSAP